MANDRRTFLQKLTLGVSALAAWPLAAYDENNTKKDMTNKADGIKQVKPLGFQWETLDPFLFCVHHEDKFPKGNDVMGPASGMSGRNMGNDFLVKDGFRMYHGKNVPGFPGHPHRGFETITIVRQGIVDHADSMGAAGRYGNGDVQWMTAGKGVQHSEMFPLLSKEEENPMELFQIWLNLPAKNKMSDPDFKMFWHENLPKHVLNDVNGIKTTVEIIAGTIFGKKAPTPPSKSWAANPANEVAVLNILIDANGTFKLPKAGAATNRTLYFYSGEKLTVNGREVPNYNAIEVHADVELTLKNGSKKGSILVLQGKPIGEPVMQYGPFVMNTKAEIEQAFQDYHKTQYGGWPWPKYEMVHDRNSGRFAIHADGRKETKG